MFTMARIKAVRGKGKEFFLNHHTEKLDGKRIASRSVAPDA